MNIIFGIFGLIVLIGIIAAVIKGKKPGVNSGAEKTEPGKFRPAPSFGSAPASPDDQASVDTAKAAAGFNQPQG